MAKVGCIVNCRPSRIGPDLALGARAGGVVDLYRSDIGGIVMDWLAGRIGLRRVAVSGTMIAVGLGIGGPPSRQTRIRSPSRPAYSVPRAS
jgi:hypothetical protein